MERPQLERGGYVYGWGDIATWLTLATRVELSAEAVRDCAKQRYRGRQLAVEHGRRRVRATVGELGAWAAWFVAEQGWGVKGPAQPEACAA